MPNIKCLKIYARFELYAFCAVKLSFFIEKKITFQLRDIKNGTLYERTTRFYCWAAL